MRPILPEEKHENAECAYCGKPVNMLTDMWFRRIVSETDSIILCDDCGF